MAFICVTAMRCCIDAYRHNNSYDPEPSLPPPTLALRVIFILSLRTVNNLIRVCVMRTVVSIYTKEIKLLFATRT